MKTPTAASSGTAGRASAVMAAVVDSVVILAFAAVGRGAHERGDIISGVFLTAWPFLAGAAVGWLSFRLWRRPFAVVSAGLPVWLASVAVGMMLRLATGQPVVPAFIIVAVLSLGVLLVGYRALLALPARFRTRRAGS